MRLFACFAVVLSFCFSSSRGLAQQVDQPIVVAKPTALRRALTAAIYALHARMLREKGELDGAIADCTESIRLCPSMQDAYNTRALALMKQGNVDSAIADWSKVIQLCPSWNATALSRRAAAWRAKAEFDLTIATAIEAHDFASAIDRAVGDQSSPSLATQATLERSRPDHPLQLTNVAFCDKIENYGRWTRFRRDEFTPGQPVLLYADVDNFTSERTSEGTWRAILKSTIEIFDQHGNLVQRMPFAPNEDLCQSVRRDYYNSYEFLIPSGCAPGPHTLKLTIADMLGTKTADSSIHFTVK
ncbi:MAG TPA: tetratricopeptide repeat protein [Planctomycetaceae bacterium]|jgi:tetratricopeptide (TPR) repeat protein|nr:tetratricopeptide repeat protein [Planctomycetaceae bacterium]